MRELQKNTCENAVYCGILLRDIVVMGEERKKIHMWEKIKKKMPLIWVFVILVLVILQAKGVVQSDVFYVVYGILIAGFFVVSVKNNQKALEQCVANLEELKPLLHQDPDAYLQKLEEQYRSYPHIRSNRTILALMLTHIGMRYIEKEDAETALQKLLSVPEKGLNANFAPYYYIHLGRALFYADKSEAGCKLLVLKVKQFEQAKQNPELVHYYHILQILAMLADVQRKEARAYLMQHPELQQREDCKVDLKYINQKL